MRNFFFNVGATAAVVLPMGVFFDAPTWAWYATGLIVTPRRDGLDPLDPRAAVAEAGLMGCATPSTRSKSSSASTDAAWANWVCEIDLDRVWAAWVRDLP